jgi:thiamine-monophosphate kinase
MKEFSLIEKFFKPLTRNALEAGNLQDDVAKISLKKDEELVISKDVFVEDVHFLKSDGGFKIAEKLLRTNLSDIASSGAKPVFYLLGFAKNSDQKFIKEFAAGLKSVQDEFDISLIGGDTVKSGPKLFFSLTIFGVVKKGKILARNQAKKGDLVFVSGSIGDAFLGLQIALGKRVLLKDEDKKYLLKRHYAPTPRVILGQNLLRQKLSSCAIDVSDGLLSDLKHVCRSSNLSAEIYQNKIPLSPSAQNFLNNNSDFTSLDLISGGDDYELIFTSAPKNLAKINDLAKKLKLPITCIGKMVESSNSVKVTLLDEKNHPIKITKLGYEH